jgi:hypothetical protein
MLGITEHDLTPTQQEHLGHWQAVLDLRNVSNLMDTVYKLSAPDGANSGNLTARIRATGLGAIPASLASKYVGVTLEQWTEAQRGGDSVMPAIVRQRLDQILRLPPSILAEFTAQAYPLRNSSGSIVYYRDDVPVVDVRGKSTTRDTSPIDRINRQVAQATQNRTDIADQVARARAAVAPYKRSDLYPKKGGGKKHEKAESETKKTRIVLDEEGAYKATIELLAGGLKEAGVPYTRLSPKALEVALTDKGADPALAQAIHKELRDKGYIAKDWYEEKGYEVILTQDDFQKILAELES